MLLMLSECASQTKSASSFKFNQSLIYCYAMEYATTPDRVPSETKSPMKRPRASSVAFAAEQSLLFSCKMKETIDSLFHFHSTEGREAAIVAALDTFNHSDETLHNAAVEAGAFHALLLQLGYTLHCHDKFRPSDIWNTTLRNILQALSLVYQCSDIVRKNSFQATGDELIPLLITSIVRSKQSSSNLEDQQQKYDEVSITYAMRILHLLSVLDSARNQMITYRSLLEMIVQVLSDDSYDRARSDAMGILRHFSTHTDEYKVRLVRFPQLLPSLVRLCCLNTSSRQRSKGNVAFIIRHLSMNKLAKLHIAEHGEVINMMVQLSSDKDEVTRREAISAILGLALAVENRVLLMRQSEGAIAFSLARILRSENDCVVRRRAARALRCLACVDTVDLLLCQKYTVETLSKVAFMDNSEEVRIESAKALSSWAMVQVIPISRHDTLLHALVHTLFSETTACADAASAAILYQATATSNHLTMASNDRFMASLFRLVYHEMASTETRENAVMTFFHLSTTQHDLVMQQKGRILHVFVQVLAGNIVDNFSHDCKHSCVDAIQQLASQDSIRGDIAKHSGLMLALLHYSASVQDMSRKDTAKKTIMTLVPYL